MLKLMREKKKALSWVLWLVILAFVGFIFVQWGAGRLGGGGLDRDVAAVGRQTISGEEFQKNLARTLEMYGKQFKDGLSRQAINQLGIAEQVLQGMVTSRMVQGEAARLGLTVSDAELGEAIRRHPSFQRDGSFIGSEEYERLLAYNHITVIDFEASLRQDLLADKLKALVAAGVALDLDKLREDYRKENDKAELEYIAFRAADVKEEPALADAELRAYYAGNRERFRGEEKRAGQALALTFADFKKQVAIKEQDLFAYYQQNKSLFRVPGKTRVSRIRVPYGDADREQVLQQLEATAAALTPETFAAKAREISKDDKAQEGGDWGYWGWQSFSAQEKSLIDSLRAGGISSPVDAGGAFALLYVSEKTEEQQESYDAVKPRIRTVLENDRLRELVGQRLAQARQRIGKEKGLQDAAAQLGAKVTDTGLLTRGQPIPGLDENGTLSQQLFAMAENDVSDPVEFPAGFAILRLTRVVKPQVEPFEAVRDKVAREAGVARKLEQLQGRARQVADALNRLADAKKTEEYLKKEALKLESASYQRGNSLAGMAGKPGLDDAVFALPESSFSAPLTLQDAVVVVRPKSRKLTGDADFAREREAYTRRRVGEAQDAAFGSFLLSRKERYPVRFNGELFEKVKDSALSRYR